MDATYRQIFTDGRPLPELGIPSFKGYSSGTWQGDTLVVETTGFPDGIWLDRSGSPLTDAARITERFRRVNFGRMEIEMTVDDPKAYTRPWTFRLIHKIVLDTELMDYICTENEKDALTLSGSDPGSRFILNSFSPPAEFPLSPVLQMARRHRALRRWS